MALGIASDEQKKANLEEKLPTLVSVDITLRDTGQTVTLSNPDIWNYNVYKGRWFWKKQTKKKVDSFFIEIADELNRHLEWVGIKYIREIIDLYPHLGFELWERRKINDPVKLLTTDGRIVYCKTNFFHYKDDFCNMFCTNCGPKNPNSANYCGKCGNKLYKIDEYQQSTSASLLRTKATASLTICKNISYLTLISNLVAGWKPATPF
ncbi:zinc ribbon domain-containing protein [candidate division KSB1 bacterium]|nr:zinc ribbon domain-containing protein [candidate division KSB1 bacterium]